MFGTRIEGETIVVKIPLCSTDVLRRVEVTDFDDAKHETPAVLWWASIPTEQSAKEGIVRLWSAEGFEEHAAKPMPVPRNLDVGYTDPSGDGRDDVVNPRTAAKATLKAGEYWTSKGPRTTAQIDAQLHCKESR